MIYVPYTEVRPEVRAALTGLATVWLDVSRDERAYWWYIRQLWADGLTFTLVEHDIVPERAALLAMVGCAEDWCAIPYRVGEIETPALGCTKFTNRIMARHPDLLAHLPEVGRHWLNLDGAVIGELHRRGEREHLHGPRAAHLVHIPDDLHRRSTEARRVTKLIWVGDGSRYIHEDVPAGIPPMPPADFETDDPRAAAVALASGLYTEASSSDTQRRGRRQASMPAAPDAPSEPADGEAPADAPAELEKE